MFRRTSALVVIIATAVLTFGVVAPAAHAAEPEPGREGTILVGRGVLDAQGDGLAAVRGRLDLYARSNRGIMLVKDVAGDAVIRVDGDGRTAHWNGFTVYFGVEGRSHVTGSDVAVIIVGNDIDLHVIGKGWAFLKGEGTFEVNNRGPFRWTNDGAFASLSDPG